MPNGNGDFKEWLDEVAKAGVPNTESYKDALRILHEHGMDPPAAATQIRLWNAVRDAQRTF